jgi:hypothetical protein
VSMEIPLTRGLVALVDDEDYGHVVAAGPWHAAPGGNTFYARHSFSAHLGGDRFITLHAFLMGHRWVDHANGNGLDNRRSNLRPTDAGLNAGNRAQRKDSTTPYKGVQRQPAGTPWRAQICHQGRKRHLGLFGTAEDAARAYDEAAIEAWGDHARLNFPKEKTA